MKKAFTLIELLMVIAILGIISTLAVSKVGNLQRSSALKVSLSNQSAISRAIESYITVNNGRLNRLDSLMYKDGVRAEGQTGFNYALTNGTRLTGQQLYRGPSRPAVFGEKQMELNAGLTDELRTLLVPYALDAREADAFVANLGLRFVMCHTASAEESPRVLYGEYGVEGDGHYLPDDAAVGWDPMRSACVPQAVSNGLYLAAVSPSSGAGRQVYRDCGQELFMTARTDQEYDEEECRKEALSTGGILFAFGLGDECSAVGKSSAGLEAAPLAKYLLPKYYRRYILLFRLNAADSGVPEFAGVLDPSGRTIRAARKDIDDK